MDTTTALKQAISMLRPELPALVGDDWPEFESQLAHLLQELDADPNNVQITRAMILALFASHRQAHERLTEVMAELTSITTEGTRGTDQQTSDATAPTAAIRYTDIQLPARVQVERRFAVIVGLTIAPSPDSADAQPVKAVAGQAVRVVLTPAGALEVLGERVKELRVEAERDSDPAVFYLRASEAGLHDLSLEFWADGQIVASSRHSIEAVVEGVTDTPSLPAGQPIQAGAAVAPYPNLVLRITTEGNRLHYDLYFDDVRFSSVPGERLRTDPETYRYELIREIERQLAKIGQRLYKELFSADLRREYRSFSRQITTLQIISDEPWIPWELIKPYDDEGDEIIDHDYLCMQFEFARWFTPARAPAARIEVDSLACVAPGDSKLVEAQGEKDDLHRLAQELRLLDLTPAHATYEAVVQTLLEGDTPIRLWHFACHGDFENEAPGKSPLILEGRQPFTPDDIVGRAQTRLKRDQPFVFLNACRVGQSGLALTGMGGWAKVLIQDCGVGGFLAPVWEVDDVQARRFAATFYDFIRRTPKCTLAQAVREARSVLRELPEHDPTWLAYSLYAHPNARVVL